jgi:6-phosphogluconate dehydrogenase
VAALLCKINNKWTAISALEYGMPVTLIGQWLHFFAKLITKMNESIAR